MANLIDARTQLEGIIYAFIDEEGSLTISSSNPDHGFLRYNYREELVLSPEGVKALKALLVRDAQLRIGADDAGQKSPTCNPNQHIWRTEYYGYKCEVCQRFVPYGSEPWLPVVE